MSEIRVYVEGFKTSAGRRSPKDVRWGLKQFLTNYAPELSKVVIKACEGRPIPEYANGVRAHPNAKCFLLMDADKIIGDQLESHYQGQDLPMLLMQMNEWIEQGITSSKERLHFMVMETEAWFVADPDAMSSYFGSGFKKAALPRRTKVEDIPKGDLADKLNLATVESQKGKYNKANHAPDLWSLIDPKKVVKRADHCRKFLEELT